MLSRGCNRKTDHSKVACSGTWPLYPAYRHSNVNGFPQLNKSTSLLCQNPSGCKMRLRKRIVSEFLEQKADSLTRKAFFLFMYLYICVQGHIFFLLLVGQLLKQHTRFKWSLSLWAFSHAMGKCSYYFHDKVTVLYSSQWL